MNHLLVTGILIVASLALTGCGVNQIRYDNPSTPEQAQYEIDENIMLSYQHNEEDIERLAHAEKINSSGMDNGRNYYLKVVRELAEKNMPEALLLYGFYPGDMWDRLCPRTNYLVGSIGHDKKSAEYRVRSTSYFSTGEPKWFLEKLARSGLQNYPRLYSDCVQGYKPSSTDFPGFREDSAYPYYYKNAFSINRAMYKKTGDYTYLLPELRYSAGWASEPRYFYSMVYRGTSNSDYSRKIPQLPPKLYYHSVYVPPRHTNTEIFNRFMLEYKGIVDTAINSYISKGKKEEDLAALTEMAKWRVVSYIAVAIDNFYTSGNESFLSSLNVARTVASEYQNFSPIFIEYQNYIDSLVEADKVRKEF